MQIVDVFRARIVDVTNSSFIVEITGDEDKIEGFIDLLRPWGIIEMARTGLVSMARGAASILPEGMPEQFKRKTKQIYYSTRRFITMATMKFGDMEEVVVTRQEFPLEKAQQVLKNEVVAILGYGVQGPAQALNMKENGINVIVGVNEGGQIMEKST